MQAFYDAAADGVREAFDDADEELSLARVEDAKWSGYFDAPADFMNVTLDQKTRFEVPKVELLTRLGLNADIAIVFDEMRFSRSETLDSVDIGGTKSLRVARSLSCSAKFLVWDYGRHRPLAEGSVHADVGTGKDVELENWRELAEDMAAEIVSKRPFVRP